MELKGFAKTRLLQPGESQVLQFTLNAGDLASFDSRRSSWIAEPGIYEVWIGASSADIKGARAFKLDDEIIVQKTTQVLVPDPPIEEMTAN